VRFLVVINALAKENLENTVGLEICVKKGRRIEEDNAVDEEDRLRHRNLF